jgi:hypothetical protein
LEFHRPRARASQRKNRDVIFLAEIECDAAYVLGGFGADPGCLFKAEELA